MASSVGIVTDSVSLKVSELLKEVQLDYSPANIKIIDDVVSSVKESINKIPEDFQVYFVFSFAKFKLSLFIYIYIYAVCLQYVLKVLFFRLQLTWLQGLLEILKPIKLSLNSRGRRFLKFVAVIQYSVL